MTLTELCTEVHNITNRSDLVNETKTAVRSATLKLHQSDYFYKDLYETGIAFTSSTYKQQLEYRTLIPRWRSLKYLRKTDANGFDEGAFFEVLSIPEMVEDSYGINRKDVCYVAGSVVQILSSTEFQYAILGCYLHPDITELNYNSWVALDHPYAIVCEAAASVFKMTGDNDKFSAYTALAREERRLMILSNISAIGF